MEVFVDATSFSSWVFPEDSAVRDILNRFYRLQGFGSQDFYVIRNGRLSDLDEPLQHGAVYHLQPRLCGGKGGFGSMLRALGAQIEKTTNREACRDLSGRRLRDVNHEKEMAEWLKKQTEREAEKEQRRLERLQRKLREPEHRFSDIEYQQQCHELSERLEDSVIKGLQASSSGQAKADDASTMKRLNSGQSEQPRVKRKKTASFWAGLDDLPSSEDDDEAMSSSSSSATVTMATQSEDEEPEQSGSSSVVRTCGKQTGPPDQQETLGTCSDQTGPSDQQESPGTSSDQTGSLDQQESPGSCSDQTGPLDQQEFPWTCSDQTGASEQQETPGTCSDQTGPSDQQESLGTYIDQTGPSDQQETPGTCSDQTGPSDQQETPGTSSDQTGPSDHQESPGTCRDQATGPPGDCEPSKKQVQPVVDLSSVSSVDQLEVLGLDILKEELRHRGLKCGGTLTERAARLFSIKDLSPDQINPALLTKPTKVKRKC